jgi:hypothetical protein
MLTSHAAHVKELWQDMATLGLYNCELWDTIDLAWEIVLEALNLVAAGIPRPNEAWFYTPMASSLVD